MQATHSDCPSLTSPSCVYPRPFALPAWHAALSADHGWALLIDAQGRNIAEVHRPAVAAGPLGRALTFAQAVQLMAAAPELLALVRAMAAVEADGTGQLAIPALWREQAQRLLAACA